MSEATETTAAPTPQKTVRQYRHEVRGSLESARRMLPSSSGVEAIQKVRQALNGAISSVLAGKQGLSQKAQVDHLQSALDKVKANLATLPGLLSDEAAKPVLDEAAASLKANAANEVAQIEGALASHKAEIERLEAALVSAQERAAADDDSEIDVADAILAAAGDAQKTLEEAVEYASNRDFAAHQQAKGHSVGTSDEAPPVYGADDEDDEDDSYNEANDDED